MLFEDGMKKESKACRSLLIMSCSLEAVAIISLLVKLTGDTATGIRDGVKWVFCYFLFVIYSLYYFLYSRKYRVVATAEGVRLRTLFRTQDIWFRDVEGYTCKRYRKSVFYQFRLYTGRKKVLINTRYRDEMMAALQNAQIPQRTK